MTKPGPIQIRNAEVVENIRELARLRGAGLTETVEAAVRETLERERISRRAADVGKDAEIEGILRRFRALPRTGPLLGDDDLYDEDGLPK
ncbi:type II toxin-antitoxin system VapB family antitoxin [Caulobacter sp. LjRoot300]|uniref:type II toxin-antitoxin system VapB family antitoxin n=1 Tax=Caulobacter sp. LjRoot300 TaxID=3342321 RepID=UPI003ECF0CE6